MANQQVNLKKLLEIYNSKLKILKEFKNISLEIGEAIEKKGEEVADVVDELTKKRELLLDKIKEADMAVRYSESLLEEKYQKIIKEVKSAVKSGMPVPEQEWSKILAKILAENIATTKDIKYIDEKNEEAIKNFMDEIKNKIKDLKGNKRFMNKFANNFSAPYVGTLMNEKK